MTDKTKLKPQNRVVLESQSSESSLCLSALLQNADFCFCLLSSQHAYDFTGWLFITLMHGVEVSWELRLFVGKYKM